MLFHITHVHSPETCPYHHPETARETFGKMMHSAEGIGVNLIGSWVDAPDHTIYLVVETDSVQKLEEFLAPAFEIGVAETRPVSNAMEVLQRTTAQ